VPKDSDKMDTIPNGESTATVESAGGGDEDMDLNDPNGAPAITKPPLILPTQAVESKEVVLLNVDSWSALNTEPDAPSDMVTESQVETLKAETQEVSPSQDGLWSEFKNRKAQNMQREKERSEAELVIQQQLKEKEEAEKKRIEEKRKQDMELQVAEREAKEKEMQMLREAERKKRSREAPTINLTSQSDIMADFERGLNTRQTAAVTDASFLLGLGLKRTEDEEAI